MEEMFTMRPQLCFCMPAPGVNECALKGCKENATRNYGFGAEKGASDHNAEEGVPFFQRKFGDRSHVLQPAIVDED
jgi:hypothetical protein